MLTTNNRRAVAILIKGKV